MEWLVERLQAINELAYRKLVAKQSTVDQLFPGKFKGRVKAVRDNGGFRMKQLRANVWEFEVASGTDKKKSYTVYIHFKNIKDRIAEACKDPHIWTPDKSRVSLMKLASELLFATDLEMTCTCEADRFYNQFVRTRMGAKYTEPENRPADIRNPKRLAAFCKHTQVVFDQLPMLLPTMERFLKDTYGAFIKKCEREERFGDDERQAEYADDRYVDREGKEKTPPKPIKVGGVKRPEPKKKEGETEKAKKDERK